MVTLEEDWIAYCKRSIEEEIRFGYILELENHLCSVLDRQRVEEKDTQTTDDKLKSLYAELDLLKTERAERIDELEQLTLEESKAEAQLLDVKRATDAIITKIEEKKSEAHELSLKLASKIEAQDLSVKQFKKNYHKYSQILDKHENFTDLNITFKHPDRYIVKFTPSNEYAFNLVSIDSKTWEIACSGNFEFEEQLASELVETGDIAAIICKARSYAISSAL